MSAVKIRVGCVAVLPIRPLLSLHTLPYREAFLCGCHKKFYCIIKLGVEYEYTIDFLIRHVFQHLSAIVCFIIPWMYVWERGKSGTGSEKRKNVSSYIAIHTFAGSLRSISFNNKIFNILRIRNFNETSRTRINRQKVNSRRMKKVWNF